MSMQRVINYGSFLQAYALKSVIEKQNPESDVVFLDFHTDLHLSQPTSSKKIRITRKIKSGLLRLVSKKIREKALWEKDQNDAFVHFCDVFCKEYLPLLGVNENYCYNTDVDVLFIGSDEVFNYVQNQIQYGYSLELFGENIDSKKLFTYAASFGNTTLQMLENHNACSIVSNCLRRFTEISVRDENSRAIVNELTDIKPYVHVDPVLIYDFSEETPQSVDLKNYIIVYAYSGRLSNEEIVWIQKFAQKHGKKTLSIGIKHSFTDEYRCVDPFTMLSYFKNADYVITDTFHGTVFSIKYQIPFATLIRDSNSEKLKDLLYRFNLSDRAFECEEELNKVMVKPLAKSDIISKIDLYKKDSINYITSVLLIE